MEEYTKEYYQAINKLEEPQAKALSVVLTRLYSPTTIADVGCGTGLYLEHFNCEKKGFDISEAAFSDTTRKIDRDLLRTIDLRIPLTTGWKNDLALCLEVVEHIGSEYADDLVRNISMFSDTLIVTAAPPGQAGLNHVNCQPQAYWDEKFAKLGYRRDYHDEYQIVSHLINFPHTVWIIRNLMVYKR